MAPVTLDMQIKPFILLILVTSFVSLTILFNKTNESIGNKREVFAFRGMLLSFMAYTLVDLRLLIGDRFYTGFPILFVYAVMAIGFCSMSFSSYFWFMYVLAGSHIKAKPLRSIIYHIPLFICLILFMTPLNHYVYEVGETAMFKPLMQLVLLLDYIYLISATVLSCRNVKRARNKLEKRKYRTQIIFIVFYTLSGVLIGFLLNLPAIEICVNPIVLKLFVDLQDSQIYTDALTKLNNRRRMNELITEEIASCNNENPLTIIMLDMDYFKSINDILGHDEGDRALVSFAHCLHKVTRSKNAFAGRWGGDEFVVAGKEKDLDKDFRETLSSALENNKDLSYVLPFSLGVVKCTSPAMTCEEAMTTADEALYKDKEIQHSSGEDFIKKLNKLKA